MADQRGTIALQINVNAERAASEIDELTRSLLREIDRDIPVETAMLATQRSPEATRSGEAVTIGVIVLTILPVFLDKLVDFILSWTQRNTESKVTLSISTKSGRINVEYDPKKMSREELKKIIKDAKSNMRLKE